MSPPLPNPELGIVEPTETELRSIRKMVRDHFGGEIIKDTHTGRSIRMKMNPGKFASQSVALTNCDHDHVLCDIPIDGETEPLRICLICDSAREMFGLNGREMA
jgi:hypothetical protein